MALKPAGACQRSPRDGGLLMNMTSAPYYREAACSILRWLP